MHASPQEYAPNRLIGSASPYLLQHAHNPVAWQPWDGAALAEARRDDKPIFLSIGYAACHWCHVMERESFVNPEIAAILNEQFIPIKVDREERPDLDNLYMTAVAALTGAGGWPMSVFLTPDLKPFYGGTYYPPEDRWGRPGFRRLLLSVAGAWRQRRAEILTGAEELAGFVRTQLTAGAAHPPGMLDDRLLSGAAQMLVQAFDSLEGGWGPAPKFPSAASIDVLLRHHHHAGDVQSLHMAQFTLDKMARGGIHDQVGGGFHRYSVDGEWLVPHFEKMLYDNAQLARVYLEAWQATGDPLFRQVAEDTLEYVLSDLQDPEGAFHASEDADSGGEEGLFYLWTPEEITDTLGPEDGALFCQAYVIRSGGNFSSHEPCHEGKSIPHRVEPVTVLARRLNLAPEGLEARLQALCARVRTARARRARPGRDDKVVAAWNGLMITALARAAQAFDEPRYAAAAVRAAAFVWDRMRPGGRLVRTWRAGVVGPPAFLEDYAALANGFVDLYEAAFDTLWLDRAALLTEEMRQLFGDADAPGFFHAAPHHADLLVRSKPWQDGVEPSGNTLAAAALLRLGRYLDRPDWLEQAGALLQSQAGGMAQAPQACLQLLCAADDWVGPPLECSLAQGPGGPPVEEFLRVLRARYLPGRLLAMAAENAPPMARGRGPVAGRSAVYLCAGGVCEPPITGVAALTARLDRR